MSTGTATADEHDPTGALGAVESDLEYFRTKRFEPRVLHLIRRGALSLVDLATGPRRAPAVGVGDPARTVEERVRALQDRLDAYVTGIAAMSVPGRTVTLVIDDVRRERGDYDPFFRLAKRHHHGSLEDRVGQLETELAEAHDVLEVVTEALVARGEIAQGAVEARRAELAGLGYRNGARIVARAWTDPEFKQRLLATGREALRDLDVPPGRLGRLAVAEDTHEVHNVVVCTLCSCYPHDLLGDPPWWYRSDEYKERIVDDPRSALDEMFGLRVDDARTIRVHDSTSDLRWMVLPRRPAGTDGWDEEQLAALVTSESLVGVAELDTPGMTFTPGQRVVVLPVNPDGNPRTPRYLRGRTGTVVDSHGVVVNPLDHREPYPPLYTLVFSLDTGDEVTADLHEEWLRAAP